MHHSSQLNQRTTICALIGGLALAASAWAGPLGTAGFGAGGFGGIGVGRGLAADGMAGAGGYGSIGMRRGISVDGAAGAYGQVDSRIAPPPTDVTHRVDADVNGSTHYAGRAAGQAQTDANGSMQYAGRAAGQVDASTSVAGSASARQGRVQAGGSASGQANAEAEVSR